MEEFALRLRLGGYFGIWDWQFKNTPPTPLKRGVLTARNWNLPFDCVQGDVFGIWDLGFKN